MNNLKLTIGGVLPQSHQAIVEDVFTPKPIDMSVSNEQLVTEMEMMMQAPTTPMSSAPSSDCIASAALSFVQNCRNAGLTDKDAVVIIKDTCKVVYNKSLGKIS